MASLLRMIPYRWPELPDPAPPAGADAVLYGQLAGILRQQSLQPHFQPIIHLGSGDLLGHEGLIRGPAGSPLHAPLALFAAAESCGLLAPLERACRRRHVTGFRTLGLPGKLFLNVSPDCLAAPDFRSGETLQLLEEIGLPPASIVIELTETRHTGRASAFAEALAYYRNMEFQVALDDLGEGFSNLRRWDEWRPDFVKIDKYFVQNIHLDRAKQRFVQSMVEIGAATGSRLIAEGIENEAELATLGRLGVQYGQGYLLGRPEPSPPASLPPEIRMLLQPSAHLPLRQRATAGELCFSPPVMPPDAICDLAWRAFGSDPHLYAIPVVSTDGRPVGLLRRHHVLETFARPFSHELFGKKPCEVLMDRAPLVVDVGLSLEALSKRMVAAEQRYLIDGFILTQDDRYVGMGTGFELMKRITAMQIAAARYANPLTGLPGNVPINETIDSLIDAQRPFVVAYADLDHFKPFNDLYGYHLGDELIALCGQILGQHSDPEDDFVGHLGGDDFIVVLQSEDWQNRLGQALARFDAEARACFRPEHLEAGGYRMVGRNGEAAFFPLVSLSIGAVRVEPGLFPGHHELAASASEAKKMAKRLPGSSLFVERRRPFVPAEA